MTTPRQRARIAQHEGVLVEPTIGGERGVVVVYLDGHRWGLPNGVRIAPGKDVLYVCGVGGKITVLVPTGEGIRELQIDLRLAAEIRKTYFQR